MARDVPENPPGTRGLRCDPALVPFSRDHHFALMQAQALARAARAGEAALLARARDEYLRWFAGEGEPHFADEELAKRREARGRAPACPTRVPDSSG